MKTPTRLAIQLHSETTFASTSEAAGWLDTEVNHDSQTGLPEIGGKTLHGLLTDSWLSISHIEEVEDKYYGAALRLLGQPGVADGEGILYIGNAQLSEYVRLQVSEAITRSEHPLDPFWILGALTRVRTQTAINRATGAALENSLRSSRTLLPLPELEFWAELSWTKEPEPTELELFHLLLGLTRHAGLRRNRGRGLIQLTALPGEASSSTHTPVHPTGSQSTLYLKYKITLATPLLITAPGGAPNEALSLGHIPGSLVRGLVAERCAEDQLNDLVLSDTVRYLNAYPEVRGQRSMPRPLSWYVEKGKKIERAKRFDLLATDSQHWPNESLEPLPHDYDWVAPDLRSARSAKRRMRIHHQRDRARGMPTDPNGALFAYEALEAGQVFRGEVQITAPASESQKLATTLQGLLSGTHFVGRSRRAEYGGRLNLTFTSIQDHEYEPASLSSPFACVLTSPYIGRNHLGQNDPTAIEGELSNLGLKVVEKRWSFTQVGGYNRHHRTELPQSLALKEGSVLLLSGDTSRLAQLAHNGLGERRNEGFGRIRFINQLAPAFALPGLDNATAGLNPNARPLPSDQGLLKVMQEHILSQALKTTVELDAVNLVGQVVQANTKLPPNSLLNRLRLVLRNHGATGLLELLTGKDAKDKEKLKPTARKHLERCRVKSGSLLDWLVQHCGAAGFEELSRLLDWPNLRQRYVLVELHNAKLYDYFPKGNELWMGEVLWQLSKQAPSQAAEEEVEA